MDWNTFIEIRMALIIILLLINILSCFGYTYDKTNHQRYCYVKWHSISEDNLNDTMIMKKIPDSSRMDCYTKCDWTENCGAAALNQTKECLLINETAIPLNKTTEKVSPKDLLVTEVSSIRYIEYVRL